MKKVICILSAAAISLSGIAVFADDAGREYTSEGGYITIANEYGLKMYHDEYANYEYYPSVDGKNAALFYKSNKAKDVIVPATINGVPVVEVRGRTGKKTGLESITFPETVQAVEEFFEYTDLKSVSFSGGIKEIPRMAFKKCIALDNIEIPPSVEKIGGAAFDGCLSLKKIVLNEGLYVIGENAFTDCAIEQLELPSTLRKIERGAFLRNKALKDLTIPNGVESIGRGAFHLSGIEKLTFQSVPETVEDNAFGETPLAEVNGLQRKDMIRLWNAFNATPWQEGMKDDAEPCLVDEDGRLVAYIGSSDEVVIPSGVKKIGSQAFTGKNISSVIIPETVNEIEETAFYECKQLTSVTIPASVTKIGQLAFSHCYRLKNITFEYSNESLQLDNCAFQFTLASPETLITNNRRYSNQKTAFQNTYFDPDYVPMMDNGRYVDESYTEPPKAMPQNTEKPSAAPEVTAKPTERPKATEKPEATKKPKATAKPISAPKPTEKPQVINVTPGESITVSVGDKEITFMDAQPFIDENGRTKIPIRAVAEGLGCEVDWDDATRTAVIKRGDDVVYITIGKDTLQVGNTTVQMDTTAEIKDDRTYIPVRFVGEALGMQVNWKG